VPRGVGAVAATRLPSLGGHRAAATRSDRTVLDHKVAILEKQQGALVKALKMDKETPV
jgi:hypothetical protein